jgi:hypothetical protein
MTYRVIIEPTVAEGIRVTAAWYARNASPAVAARWYNGLIKEIETLRTSVGSTPGPGDRDVVGLRIANGPGIPAQFSLC